jgi:organic radical activating enzyme
MARNRHPLRVPGRKTDLEVKRWIDNFSTSFCGAKWYNATIWLGSGMTTSCHHPLPHHVSVEEVQKNHKALHNTPQKKNERYMMQNSERPPGCEYCWKIEDIGRDNISDRVYKTVIFNEDDIVHAMHADHNEDVDLQTLEIAFDRTCQFACSYCNPAFSTSWVTDLKKHGPYKDLKSDGRGHYIHEHSSAQLFKPNETNPYVEAFFKWWEEDLHKTLIELRLTGGEPLMSPHTKRLIDWFVEHKTDMVFALNSNLGVEDSKIDLLIEASHNISDFQLYTSNESLGAHAEYIRDGFKWDQWTRNVRRILTEGSVDGLHVMCTINALCLESITEFFDWMMELKKEFGRNYPVFTINILRFPSFQSPLVLPDELRMDYADKLDIWLENNAGDSRLHEMEINHIQRLIDYLDVVKTPHSDTFDIPSLHNDFKKFYAQYDQRRGKNIVETFEHIGAWYSEL